MGYAQTISEQPTQPPELAPGIQLIYDSIYADTFKVETDRGDRIARRILATGVGFLESVAATGAYDTYDAGDLWNAITENQESGDLRILAGAVIAPTSPQVYFRAKAFLDPLIAEFVATHARHMADKAANLYLIGREMS